MRLLMLSEFVLLAAGLTFAPPDAKPPAKPIFPPVVQPKEKDTAPAPSPVPGAVPILGGDTVYVAAGDEPFVLFASPPGLVTVSKESGPLRFRGKFLDGSGSVETRTYSQKSIAVVEAVPGKVGRVELIALKVGETDENKAERIIIDVNGPRPPPEPDVIPPPKPKPPPIDPEPKPEPKVVVGPFWIVTVAESSQRTPEFAKFVNDTAYWQSLVKAGHSVRHYDKDDENAIKGGYVKHANKVGLPAIVFVDEDGDLVKVVKAPKTTAEVSAILKGLVNP